MTNILDFPKPQGKFLASVDFFREPDGTIFARLKDMPVDVIESLPGEVHDNMRKLALIVMKGAESLAEQADLFKPD